MKIAIPNYSDVRNFGDVLFPLVIAREVRARLPGAQIHYLTSTGSGWAGMESERLDSVELGLFDAIILGGGELVHRADSMLRNIYDMFGLDSIERPTDLVFGWTNAAAPFKAWVALGVPEPGERVREDIFSAVQTLHFVGARGSRSAARLRGCGAPVQVRQTRDLGWLFPRLLRDRASLPPPSDSPYIAVQAVWFTDVASSTTALRRISEASGLRVVLLPLTRCWQDAVLLGAVHEASGGEFVLVDDATSDLDKLAILGGAAMYIGQSMHGFIGALSQCRPAGLCVPEGDDKFTELLRDLELQQFRSASWDGIETLAQTLIQSPLGRIVQQRAAAEQELDMLFDELCAQMVAAIQPHSSFVKNADHASAL